jgi:hypothetical protein
MKKSIRIAIALAATLSLGGCISVSQRAWANGRGSADDGRAYQQLMSGGMGISNARSLHSSFNQLPWAHESAYPPFGTWKY